MPYIENELGRYYQIPELIMMAKYKGCGNGQILVCNWTEEMLDMDYLDEANWVIQEQNLNMHPDAGEILNKNINTTIYRANFSSGSACLF